MVQDSSGQRRWPVMIGLGLAGVIVTAGIGLATEVAGALLPVMDGWEGTVWGVLGLLLVLDAVLIVVGSLSVPVRRRRPGRPVRGLTAADLEVHDPVEIPGQRLPEQTAYVRRAHDERLATVVREACGGMSRMVTLVGDSSTGKTRACHEAVRSLPKRWRLWHPIDPSRPGAVLALLNEVRPRTVVWINDAHHYLVTADPEIGERVAAGLRTLLADSARTPVLILATLWPQFWRQLTATPVDGQADPHAQARALLVGTDIIVPAAFSGGDLAAVRVAASHDRRLAAAVEQAEAGRITQYLAGVPELLRRYHTATAAARAVLDTAIDARRFGHPVHLPAGLVQPAAFGYLSGADRTDLHRRHGDGWFDQVINDLDEPQRGIPGPVTRGRAAGRSVLRLADAVEQAGIPPRAAVFPPGSFWDAVAATVDDPGLLVAFADHADRRGRYRRAAQLYRCAANLGHTDGVLRLARLLERAGDGSGAQRLLQAAAADGDTGALRRLAGLRERAGDRAAAVRLFQAAADRGDGEALRWLALRRAADRDRAAAVRLFRAAAGRGDGEAVRWLTVVDPGSAERLARQAADGGDIEALRRLALRREELGDLGGAERLAREAAGRGDLAALRLLAARREGIGSRAGVERLFQEAADRGDAAALRRLALRREEDGDRGGAERLFHAAAEHGDSRALLELARRRALVGDHGGAERLTMAAADRGDTEALRDLAWQAEHGGDRAEAERLARDAADRGDTSVLRDLAWQRDQAGDAADAERLTREAVDRGDPEALRDFASRLHAAGDRAGADRLGRFGLTDGGDPADSLAGPVEVPA